MELNPRRNMLERLLGVSTRLRPAEERSVLLFFVYAFLLLLCYYLLKTIREPLLLGTAATAEIKSYAYATTAFVLLFFIPIYGALFRHMAKHQLIRLITVFFIVNLVVLTIVGRAGVEIGFVYYVWVGVFSVTILAQFWAYAADAYNTKSGQRVFPLIMVGATLGGLAGPVAAGWLFPAMGAWNLMLVSAALLALTLPLIGPAGRTVPDGSRSIYLSKEPEPPHFLSGLTLIKRDRYLLLLATVAVLLNWINTTGEYILAELVVRFADSAVAADASVIKSDIIARFYGNYFLVVNAITVLFQIFLVSRLFRWFGVRATILILPVVALAGYGLIVFLPIFSIIRVVKILENSTEYSIFNTARQALFLPLTESQKYEGKTAIDAFFWRVGDVVQAIAIYFGLNWLGFEVENFAQMNILLAAIWIMITIEIGRLFARKEQRLPANAPPWLVHGLDARSAPPGQELFYQIPPDTFDDPDPGDILTVTVKRQDGSPLPSWLKFDPATLMIYGQTPEGQNGETVLSVRATDFEGAMVEGTLVLRHGHSSEEEFEHD
jgi:AAA family ATP:ADP antiporter